MAKSTKSVKKPAGLSSVIRNDASRSSHLGHSGTTKGIKAIFGTKK